jgi:hypothetical protein
LGSELKPLISPFSHNFFLAVSGYPKLNRIITAAMRVASMKMNIKKDREGCFQHNIAADKIGEQ